MEHIKAAAVRLKDGTVHTGTVHFIALCAAFPHCTPQDVRSGAEANWTQDWEEGFMTNTGRFVSRSEATAIAAKTMTSYAPDMNNGHRVFVFGSNLAGIHGRGAALDAVNHWGAERSVGVGRQGMAYAIPTKSLTLRPIGLGQIKHYVDSFLAYAKSHPELTFLVTRVGCGLAGYRDDDIAPLFEDAPENCVLPVEW